MITSQFRGFSFQPICDILDSSERSALFRGIAHRNCLVAPNRQGHPSELQYDWRCHKCISIQSDALSRDSRFLHLPIAETNVIGYNDLKRTMQEDTLMKIEFRLIAGIAALLLLTGCGSRTDQGGADQPEAVYRQVSQADAAALMESETDYILLDVRTRQEYEQAHIPGAICIPNETIGSGEIPELPNKDQLILVYCRSGNRSKQAAGKLVKLGYTNIVEFGGITDWTGETVSGIGK